MNQEILSEIKNQDYDALTNSIEEFLKRQVSESNSNGLIFGLSGGIDSAVIGFLCSRVLKKESLALIMPDSKITPNIDTEDALKMAKSLGIEYKLIDINLISNEYAKYIEPHDLALGNLKARIRANLLYERRRSAG